MLGGLGTMYNYNRTKGQLGGMTQQDMMTQMAGYAGGMAAGSGAMATAWNPYPTPQQQLMNLSQGPAPAQMARKPMYQPINYNPALPPQQLMSLAQMPNYGYNNYMALQQGVALA